MLDSSDSTWKTAEVKMLVEAWVRSQMYDVMGRIGIRS